MGRILVVDDHDSLRKGLVRALNNAGHDVEEAANGTAAIERLQDSQFDVVLTDLRMGGADGMDVLRTTRSIQPSAAVILMTAFGSIHTAVEAMKIGAFDFVQKPFEIEEMELKIEKAIELRHLKYQVDYLRHEQQDIYDFDHIVGASGALQSVLAIVKKVARSNSTVLVRGETGTGKELIAGAIHHNSNRSNRAFVKVNCAALQENLLESEFFGHEKGAFTSADKQRIGRFEQADGGTLFLDEIGDMSQSTQAKILRVLQEHEFERLGGTRTLRVDVRIIAATNRNLTQMVQEGRFREDLFYRLNVVSVETPPLRDRKDDIPELAEFFVKRFAGELKKRIEGVHPDAQKLLARHNWPGNIRELENVIERAVLLADGPQVTVTDLQIGEQASQASSTRRPRAGRADSADRHPARRDRAPGRGRSAQDVELGAEGRGGTARHQPARDELQDQDPEHRDSAQPPGVSSPNSRRQLAANASAKPSRVSFPREKIPGFLFDWYGPPGTDPVRLDDGLRGGREEVRRVGRCDDDGPWRYDFRRSVRIGAVAEAHRAGQNGCVLDSRVRWGASLKPAGNFTRMTNGSGLARLPSRTARFTPGRFG